MLDELDLALVNAMQMRPRAPWSLLGETLGVSPVTAARRWQRLSEAGIAWVTAYGGPFTWERWCTAFLQLDCSTGRTARIAAIVAEDPHVLTVEHVADGCDLYLVTVFTDVTQLHRYIHQRLGRIEGINAVRSHLATHIYSEANGWRLGSLDASQRRHLRDGTPPAAGPAAEIRPEERELLVRLSTDGRMEQAALASATGLSASTVRRRLDRMIASDTIRFRCEIAAPHAARPVLVTYRATVPADRLDLVGHAVARLPEVRLATAVTGARNLVVVVWLRSVADSQRFESLLLHKFPELGVRERAVTLHTSKRMGRILDEQGRAVRAVPMDLWRDPVSP
ncbi:Lrp/AsnC family transcriptional regulator [Streptomyces sp. RB6PN25]|uniref:Lrp/AsnC family transcriptional regulator n=1 Tax=Streptomyces humicola TaxID=2953240 RepID=A0ABT1PXI2_9ACTN|nr:Lrp/AsnC family transcriptional regulator [Streptomyces humicola]MCQ4082379.1 Lrp/AsnC family transcriptional regulator [Streptomyces humicola]